MTVRRGIGPTEILAGFFRTTRHVLSGGQVPFGYYRIVPIKDSLVVG
jgi:hypothetical protein